jgi:tRNA U38,U39,U40 pseudouridine synthase TruA
MNVNYILTTCPRLGVLKIATDPQNDEEIDYMSALNGVLPDDIRVVGWAPVPLHFNARWVVEQK